jgi:hypothetical protein
MDFNRRTTMDPRAAWVAALGLFSLATFFPVHAQQTADDRPVGPTRAALERRLEMARRVPVTIALMDQLPPEAGNAPAVLLRRTGTTPRDVILLRRADASGAQLAGAILHLMVVRERAGDTARVDGIFRLPAAMRGPRVWERTEQVRADRIVAQLRHAEPRDVPGVGRVPAKELYLPSRAMREAARQQARGRR